jgi:hypothetical protein
MRLNKAGLRIAALAGAAALAVGWGAVSIPAARAATDLYIESDSENLLITSDGGNAVVLANLADTFVVIASKSSGGHTYREYQDTVTGLCLQADSADTFAAEGDCIGNARQFWWYDNAKLLVNLNFGTDACADGAAVSLSTGTGASCDWTIGDA